MFKKQELLDWLFRLRIYRGIRTSDSSNLIDCSYEGGEAVCRYRLKLNEDHRMAKWLTEECEGPWAICLDRPRQNRKTSVRFGRAADAVIFRLLAS